MYKNFVFLSVTLLLCSCNGLTKPSTKVVQNLPSTSLKGTKTDTLIPAVFENGQIVKLEKTTEEWQKILSEQEFYVLRKEGTERAFTGDLHNHKGRGTYTCRGCGLPLFHSSTKFDSGTGWPSFYQPADPRHITEHQDVSLGMVRVEVECARCGGHLGHVFDDGPRPTGLRYCINSVSLDFVNE